MAIDLTWLKDHFRRRQYTLWDHALDEMFDEEIDTPQIEDAMAGVIKIIRDYEERGRKRVLIAGWTARRAALYWSLPRRPLHIVIGYGGSVPRVVTVYEPHPSIWMTPERRKRTRKRR